MGPFYRGAEAPWRVGHAEATRGARPDSGVQVGHGEEEDPTGGAHMAAAAGERRGGGELGWEEGEGRLGCNGGEEERRSWAGGWGFGPRRGRKKKKKGWAERGGKRKGKAF